MQLGKNGFKILMISAVLMMIGVHSLYANAFSETLFAMHLNQSASEQFNQELQQIMYVNLENEISIQDEREVEERLNQNKIVILDATEVSDEDITQKKMTALFGIGTYAPVTILYKVEGELVLHTVHQIDSDVDELSNSDAEELTAEFVPANTLDFDLLAGDVQRALKKANIKLSRQMKTKSNSALAPVPYEPVIHYTHLVSYSNIKCLVQTDISSTQWEDLCGGKASVDLAYKLTRVRSVTTHNSDNAKYFRISLTDGQTGAGIHLSNSQNEINTWYQSNPVRNVRRGPILQRFEFEASPTSGDMNVHLSYHKPENSNPDVTKSYTKGISLGVGISGKADIGSEGPKIGGEVSASFGFIDRRTVSINHKEYKVQNITTQKRVRIAYDHRSPCDYVMGDIAIGCERSRPLWYGGHIFDDSLFNPISYQNFVPKLDAIYRAEPNKRGITTFKVTSKITFSAYYGTSRYAILAASLSSSDGSLSKHTHTLPFHYSVDWDHPVFQPEANVRIQSLGHNNMCLDVRGENPAPGTSVMSYTCHNGRNQMWGLDHLERYRSRLNPDRCLAVNSANKVVIETCNTGMNQKWVWQGDKLTTRKPDVPGFVIKASAFQDAEVVEDTSQAPTWKPYLNKF